MTGQKRREGCYVGRTVAVGFPEKVKRTAPQRQLPVVLPGCSAIAGEARQRPVSESWGINVGSVADTLPADASATLAVTHALPSSLRRHMNLEQALSKCSHR